MEFKIHRLTQKQTTKNCRNSSLLVLGALCLTIISTGASYGKPVPDCSQPTYVANLWSVEIPGDTSNLKVRRNLFKILKLASMPGFSITTDTLANLDSPLKLLVNFNEKLFVKEGAKAGDPDATDLVLAASVKSKVLARMAALLDPLALVCVPQPNESARIDYKMSTASMEGGVGEIQIPAIDPTKEAGGVTGSNGGCKIEGDKPGDLYDPKLPNDWEDQLDKIKKLPPVSVY